MISNFVLGATGAVGEFLLQMEPLVRHYEVAQQISPNDADAHSAADGADKPKLKKGK